MNRNRTPGLGGDFLMLLLTAVVIVVAKWVWAHRVEIGTTLAVMLLIALCLIAFHRIGRYVQRREAEHEAIARRADIQEWQIADGDPAGIYGYIPLNDTPCKSLYL